MPEKSWADQYEIWEIDDEAGQPWDFDLYTEYIDWDDVE